MLPDHDSRLAPGTLPGIRDRGGLALGAAPEKRVVTIPTLTGWAESLDLVRIGLAGILIVSISAVHMYLGPLRLIRPSLTLLAAVVLMVVLKPRLVQWSNIRESWPAMAVLVFFGLSLSSTLLGISPGGSFGYLSDRYIKVLIFFFLTVAGTRTVKDFAMMMWTFVISVGIVVILAFTVLELNTTSDGLGRLDGGATMFDANDIGMIMLMCLPIATMLMLNARKAGKMLAIAVLIGIPAVIALTGSRGALIGLGVTLPVMFFVLSRVNVLVRLGVAGALFVSLYVAAPPGYWKQMETLLNPSKDYNSSDEYGRMGIAKRGVEYMLQYPVAGVGIANFPRAEGTLSPIARERLLAGEAVQWIAPHNTYVQVGAELGFPGLAVWLVLLWGGSIGLWQLRRQLPARWDHETADRRFLREATLFVPVSYVAFAVTSFFLSHAYTPPPYIIIAYHASLLVLIRRELRADRAGLKAAVTVPSASPARPLGRGGLTQGIAAR